MWSVNEVQESPVSVKPRQSEQLFYRVKQFQQKLNLLVHWFFSCCCCIVKVLSCNCSCRDWMYKVQDTSNVTFLHKGSKYKIMIEFLNPVSSILDNRGLRKSSGVLQSEEWSCCRLTAQRVRLSDDRSEAAVVWRRSEYICQTAAGWIDWGSGGHQTFVFTHVVKLQRHVIDIIG